MSLQRRHPCLSAYSLTDSPPANFTISLSVNLKRTALAFLTSPTTLKTFSEAALSWLCLLASLPKPATIQKTAPQTSGAKSKHTPAKRQMKKGHTSQDL